MKGIHEEVKTPQRSWRMEEPVEGIMGSSGAPEPAPALPKSFSYRVEHGNEPASIARSPNNSPSSSRMSSRESLLGSRRESGIPSSFPA